MGGGGGGVFRDRRGAREGGSERKVKSIAR